MHFSNNCMHASDTVTCQIMSFLRKKNDSSGRNIEFSTYLLEFFWKICLSFFQLEFFRKVQKKPGIEASISSKALKSPLNSSLSCLKCLIAKLFILLIKTIIVKLIQWPYLPQTELVYHHLHQLQSLQCLLAKQAICSWEVLWTETWLFPSASMTAFLGQRCDPNPGQYLCH